MVNVPENPQSHQPDRAGSPLTGDAALTAGLAALQRGEFEEAIAHFKAASQTGDPATQTHWRSQMGLVKAYAGLGNWEHAIARCQPLIKADNPSIQKWAREWLLANRTRAKSASQDDLAAGLTRMKPQRPTPPPTPAAPSPETSEPVAPVPSPPPAPEPEVATASPTAPASESVADIPWRMAGRATQRVSLGQVDYARLWALMALSLLGLGAVLRAIAQSLQSAYNSAVTQRPLSFLLARFTNYTDPLYVLIPLLLLTFGLSYWGMCGWLGRSAGLQPLSTDTLQRYSPEAKDLLTNRKRHGKHYPAPGKVGYLPTDLPLVLTYGLWPKQSQLVISQGALDILAEDELAAMVAAELAHLRFRDSAFLSGLVGLAQLPYAVYLGVAAWGDRRRNGFLKALAVMVSTLAYGLFWVIRLFGLWPSRLRLDYSDRAASELTGNPNGLSLALLKLAIGTAQAIERHGSTPPLLERLDLLTSVGVQSAVTLGSLYPRYPDSALLEWDRCNRFRPWLVFRDSHPPVGARLSRLHRYAQTMRLLPEFDFSALPKRQRPTLTEARPLVMQSLPWLGLILGAMLGQGLWWFGAIADRMQWFSLDWFRNDFIVFVFGAIGFSLGTLLRFNPFFPEIKRPSTVPAAALPDLLRDPNALPGQPVAVRLSGQLLGRNGIAGAIAQDLWLKTNNGLLRLHFLPDLSTRQLPIAGWLQLQPMLQRPIAVTGWFRRGTTPWLDLHSLHTQQGKPLLAGHPLWSFLLVVVLTLWSCYQIITGDL